MRRKFQYTEHERGFIKGFAYCIATLITHQGMGTDVQDLWNCNSLTIEEMKAACVDNYEISILKKHRKALKLKNK